MTRPIKSVAFAILILVMLAMAGLTIAEYHFGTASLMYVTLPGLICGLLITGGHGGTNFQEIIAEILAVGINMTLTALLFLAAFYWIPKVRQNKSSAK